MINDKKSNKFSDEELQQTHLILNLSELGSRTLVKGFTIDSKQSQDLDDAIWVETHGERGKIQIHIRWNRQGHYLCAALQKEM